MFFVDVRLFAAVVYSQQPLGRVFVGGYRPEEQGL